MRLRAAIIRGDGKRSVLLGFIGAWGIFAGRTVLSGVCISAECRMSFDVLSTSLPSSTSIFSRRPAAENVTSGQANESE